MYENEQMKCVFKKIKNDIIHISQFNSYYNSFECEALICCHFSYFLSFLSFSFHLTTDTTQSDTDTM